MQLEDYLDHRSPDDIRVRGTRIGIELVLYEYLHGSQTPEAIAARYPALSLEQVYATITYYLHNESEVRAYLDRWLNTARDARDKQQSAPIPVLERLLQAKVAATA